MPHRGRTYPYHPDLYATEAWFWPGFCPWKLYGEATAELFPPWVLIPPTWTGVSEAGVTSTDYKVISYRFSIPLTVPPLYFKVSMQLRGLRPDRKAHWKIFLPDPGPHYAVAWLNQSYPQRVVSCGGFPFFLPAPPYTPDTGPALMFRPATYAEGGSPWSD